MKLALIGAGKTGGEVVKRLKSTTTNGDQLIGPFTEEHHINDYFSKLEEADIVLIFVPGSALAGLLPSLQKLTCPVLIGSTGFSWNPDFLETLKIQKRKWIHATNFSLGMNIIRDLFKTVVHDKSLLNNVDVRITETHHIHKKDAPSGTALSWGKWLSELTESPIPITSYREGDVVGEHSVIFTTETEEIKITHRAKSRAIFAEGAIWSAKQLLKYPPQKEGLTLLEEWISTLPIEK